MMDNKPPKAEAITFKEGGEWVCFKPGLVIGAVYSIKFDNGWIWDVRNGWRSPECSHPNAYVRGSCTIGNAWCPDCNKEVDLVPVINYWLNRMRSAVGERSL